MQDSQDSTVTVRREGRIGRLTLNKPKVLNALDLAMIGAITRALDDWRDDPAVHAVVLDAAGGRAFCAGGDIRAIRDLAMAGDHQAIRTFFAEEYALNQTIADYPKPYISLIDGVCMGGGIGLSVHGSARVATEAAVFAMPETAIALFPDVGATYVLPRLRGAFGMYMALTGARAVGADAAWVGLATHCVTREALVSLADAMAEDGPAVLACAAQPAPPGGFAAIEAAVNRCFNEVSVAAVISKLEAEGTDWSRQTLDTLLAVSPSSVSWTFEIVRAGATRTLPECFAAELALTGPVTRHPDFVEGVRAMVVEKDRKPRWQPARLEDVNQRTIAEMFAAA